MSHMINSQLVDNLLSGSNALGHDWDNDH